MPNHSEEQKEECEREVPFFPNVLLSEMSLAIAAIGLLAIFVSLFPLKLGEKFNPTNPPTLLEPEWYFMGVYQFLKTENVQPFHGIILMAGLGIFVALIPFIDRGPERRPLRRPIFTAIAFFAIVEFLALTIYGYLSPGQTGSFSNSRFTTAFLTTSLLALGLVVLVFAFNRRMVRRPETNGTKRSTGASHFLLFVVTFAISVYSISNLMPLLLHAVTKGLNVADGISIIAYLPVGFLSICVLARTIYRLDKKAGRIHNKIGWFE